MCKEDNDGVEEVDTTRDQDSRYGKNDANGVDTRSNINADDPDSDPNYTSHDNDYD